MICSLWTGVQTGALPIYSEQDEAPFSAEVNATNVHLIVRHLGDPVRVQLEADNVTACAVIPRRSLFDWPAGHGFQISVGAPVETLHLYVRRSLVEADGLAMGYDGIDLEIGRASGRERVCQAV